MLRYISTKVFFEMFVEKLSKKRTSSVDSIIWRLSGVTYYLDLPGTEVVPRRHDIPF